MRQDGMTELPCRKVPQQIHPANSDRAQVLPVRATHRFQPSHIDPAPAE
jgi:hypothetical protein